MRILLISFFVCIVIIHIDASVSVSQTYASSSECKIHGQVFDLNEAIVLGTMVTYSNWTIKKSTMVSVEKGEYDLLLPAGIYDVTLATGMNKPPFKRSRIEHSCSNTLKVNLWIHPYCVSGCRSNVFSKTLPKDWSENRQLDIVITNTGSKTSKEGKVYYVGLLTYNNYTVYAEELVVDSKAKIITAKGKVRVEDGESRQVYDRVTMRFSKDGLTFK